MVVVGSGKFAQQRFIQQKRDDSYIGNAIMVCIERLIAIDDDQFAEGVASLSQGQGLLGALGGVINVQCAEICRNTDSFLLKNVLYHVCRQLLLNSAGHVVELVSGHLRLSKAFPLI